MVPTTRHGSSPVATESGGGEKWPRTKSGESERSIAVSQSPRLATNSQTRCLADSSGRTLAAVSGRVKWRRAWNPACGAASSRRAAAQVRQVVDAQTLGDFPQPGSAGGEESAQQPARGQLLQPTLPVLGVAPQPLEDPGQLTGDRGFAFAEHPPGVLHQKQVIAQRESFEHPTSPGPPPDRAAPAGADDCPGSQTPPRPPRRFPQVLRADARSSSCGRASLPRAGKPAARSASHSDTSGLRQDQPDGHAQSSWADLLGWSAHSTQSYPLRQCCYACPMAFYGFLLWLSMAFNPTR